MRKVIYSISVSLDGFIEAPGHSLDWQTIDRELHEFFNEQDRNYDVHLYGRRMYELMMEFWPTADEDPANPDYIIEYARMWKSKPKIVFSHSLDRVEGDTRLVREDIAGEIARLKAQPGKDLGLGGANIAASFMRLGLIDEYGLFIHPVILGAGTPMFPALSQAVKLKLVETRRFVSGVVYLRYWPGD